MSSASAQELEDEYADEEEMEYEEEIVEPKFFNDMNETRFRSSFEDVEESRRVNYQINNSRRDRNDFKFFDQNIDMTKFQYQEDFTPYKNYKEDKTQINSENFNFQNSPNKNEPENIPHSFKPQINSSPKDKTPNIDAVPDNGDDPNDVPLDGGVLVLGVAALGLGYKKYKM
ncbi:MAG: hypothetical protein ACOVP1_05070 [Bacteroidia bacterium]